MRIYLAGPMRGYPEFNFPAFDAGAYILREHKRNEVFSPADNDRNGGFDTKGMTGHEDLARQGFDLRAALNDDLTYITKFAQAVCVLPGWEKSSGARAEVATAHALGLLVFPIGAYVDGAVEAKHAIVPATPPSGTITPEVSDKFVAGTEIRSVSSTGGEKGTKDERFDLIPTGALASLARHYGAGARKYADNQWRKGYEWSKSYAALQRHLGAWWGGEDTDAETGSSHISAAAWHCFTILTFIDEHPDFDDRYTTIKEGTK